MEFDLNATDPEALAKIFDQIENGEDPLIKTNDQGEAKEANQAKTEPEAQGQQQAEQGQQQEEREPDGVSTKDGKHVIPYSVLKSERDRAARAEQIAREAQERLEALQAQLAAGSQGANNGESARTNQQQPTVSDLSTEDLQTLQEDFPTVYKAVMASMAAAKALEAKLAPVEESVRNAEADQARSAQETVQDAIDSVPKLAHIQANNAEAFELAKQFDATLRTQSAWADKPLSERFSKVMEMVESTIGPIEVPGSQKATSQNVGDLKKAAMAKAEQVAKSNRSNVPTSLSEFPAGQHAAQDEQEAAEQMTALQLAEKFSTMTPDQMDAYFRNL